MLKVLSIGNSFSQDAQRYLHRVGVQAGIPVKSVNLMIGGCPLWRHYRNMLSGERAYALEFNGQATGFSVSLDEALLSERWDYITFQQLSQEAPRYETYQPYLSVLSEHVRRMCPGAAQVIHQTWPYEEGSHRLTVELGYAHTADMLRDICAAYDRAAADIGAVGILRSGEALYAALEAGIPKMHRDTFHADAGVGRYLLAVLWLSALSGADLRGSRFAEFDCPVSEEHAALAREIAHRFAGRFRISTDSD